jgi:hypothetical protein
MVRLFAPSTKCGINGAAATIGGKRAGFGGHAGELYLSYTQVGDAAPLADLAALQQLDLRGTQVRDVSPLAGLTALEHLDVTERTAAGGRARRRH